MNDRSAGQVLVLGAGVAGLTAAGALARNGIPVILAEKGRRLGGHAASWACMATEECMRCASCLVTDAKRTVLDSPLVRVVTGATLGAVSRGDDGLVVRLSPASDDSPMQSEVLSAEAGLKVDALFVATGFEAFPARLKPMLGYGELKQVLTTVDLNRVLAEERIDSLPAPDVSVHSVAFLLCVGSRDRESRRDYCSQVCCRTSLRLAARLLHQRPAWRITVFYIDLQIMGKGFREFFETFQGRVRFVQGVPGEALPAADGQVALTYEDPMRGGLRTETFGLVVLAVGMIPGEDAPGLAGLLPLPADRRGFFLKEKEEAGRDQRIYSIGACRGPMDIPTAATEAMAAVGRYLIDRRTR